MKIQLQILDSFFVEVEEEEEEIIRRKGVTYCINPRFCSVVLPVFLSHDLQQQRQGETSTR